MIEPLAVIIRLALALAFGMVVGLEREWRQKQAGLRTMALVALGAAAFAMMSNTFGPTNHNPGQIAAAIVGGIGFIGAGVIMHRGATIQGVTTAATLWVDAAVGASAGLGHYALSAILTGGVVLVQFALRSIEAHLLMKQKESAPGRFELRVECDALHAVNEILAERQDLTVLRRSVQRGAETLSVRIVFRTMASVDVAELEEELIAVDGVRSLEVRHLGLEES